MKNFTYKQLVVKGGGGYPFGGYFLGAVQKTDGAVLAAVESALHPGMVHVFPLARMVAFEGTLDELLAGHYEIARSYAHQEDNREFYASTSNDTGPGSGTHPGAARMGYTAS